MCNEFHPAQISSVCVWSQLLGSTFRICFAHDELISTECGKMNKNNNAKNIHTNEAASYVFFVLNWIKNIFFARRSPFAV